ncbi:MAG TPA: methyltransferase domain-containing protein, partial [Kofleriaceae bacterium]|nr:methyltransferase domain-containing protein [Kofleriaceae bacterium]
MERIADFRTVFAQVVVARGGCPHNQRVLRAFATVPRHAFLGAGPWVISEDGTRTVSGDPATVYQDIGIGLAPGIPTGLPSLHASLLDAAAVQPGQRVMHVGAGTGYFTAILAELVGPSGQVRGFEIDEALAARARAHLSAWPWATVEARSGVVTPDPPVDVVYVNAGVQQLPRAWLDALAPGGRLVVPLVATSGQGAVLVIRREPTGFSARCVRRAGFVPCIGTQDEAASARIEELMRPGVCETVRSLALGSPGAGAGSGWQVGEDAWLSTAVVAARPRTHEEIYAGHAEEYDALVRAEDADGALIPALEAIHPLAGAAVLEVGVGTGRIARAIVRRVGRLVAVDRAPAMLAVARRHLSGLDEAAPWELHEADARALPVAAGWADVAIAGWVFGHFRSWMADDWQAQVAQALDEMRRALRPGGALIVIETLGTG